MRVFKKVVICLCSFSYVCLNYFGATSFSQNNKQAFSKNLNNEVLLEFQGLNDYIENQNYTYYFYKNDVLISKYCFDDLSNTLLFNQLKEDALIADRMAISNSDEIPQINYQGEHKEIKYLKIALLSTKNMDTHGKMFWWGYQVYFNHQTMEDIESAISIGSAASSGLTAILSVVAAEAGVVVGVLCAFVFTNFAIMKAFDKGEGVTLTQEIWGPGIYWFNSGNCIQGE